MPTAKSAVSLMDCKRVTYLQLETESISGYLIGNAEQFTYNQLVNLQYQRHLQYALDHSQNLTNSFLVHNLPIP